MFKIVLGASVIATCWFIASCGSKKSDDTEAETTTVSPSALIIPMNLKCGESPCIN